MDSAPRRPRGTGTNLPKSLRCPEQIWLKAQTRADREGVTMSRALTLLIEGYGKGMINLPKMTMQYEKPA